MSIETFHSILEHSLIWPGVCDSFKAHQDPISQSSFAGYCSHIVIRLFNCFNWTMNKVHWKWRAGECAREGRRNNNMRAHSGNNFHLKWLWATYYCCCCSFSAVLSWIFYLWISQINRFSLDIPPVIGVSKRANERMRCMQWRKLVRKHQLNIWFYLRYICQYEYEREITTGD